MADVTLDIAGGPAASLSTTAAVAVALAATVGFGALRWPKKHQAATRRARATPDSSRRRR